MSKKQEGSVVELKVFDTIEAESLERLNEKALAVVYSYKKEGLALVAITYSHYVHIEKVPLTPDNPTEDFISQLRHVFLVTFAEAKKETRGRKPGQKNKVSKTRKKRTLH